MLVALSLSTVAQAAGPLAIDVYRDPNCGCCSKWIKHLEESGFEVLDPLENDVSTVKEKLGVGSKFASCHTGVFNGQFVEGHVPAAQILELKKHPELVGIAVPGMPTGAPGMESGGRQDAYQIIDLTKTGTEQVIA